MHWYLEVLKKYAVFGGRARRKEYWMFFLFNIIVSIGLTIVSIIIADVTKATHGLNPLNTLYSLAVLLPGIAVGVRRMHDTDHSGWWLLFPIANLILAVRDGQREDNRFGSDPKATPPTTRRTVSPKTFSAGCVALALAFFIIGVVTRATGPSWPDESEERHLEEQRNELRSEFARLHVAMAQQAERTGSVAPDDQRRVDALINEDSRLLSFKHEKIHRTKIAVIENREQANYWSVGAGFFVLVLVIGNVVFWFRSKQTFTRSN